MVKGARAAIAEDEVASVAACLALVVVVVLDGQRG
jgi:hypothetical protein